MSTQKPAVPGQQQKLFGAPGQLFNVQSPDCSRKRLLILAAKDTVSPADEFLIIQPPSLPGQRELF